MGPARPVPAPREGDGQVHGPSLSPTAHPVSVFPPSSSLLFMERASKRAREWVVAIPLVRGEPHPQKQGHQGGPLGALSSEESFAGAAEAGTTGAGRIPRTARLFRPRTWTAICDFRCRKPAVPSKVRLPSNRSPAGRPGASVSRFPRGR